jgi:putative protease
MALGRLGRVARAGGRVLLELSLEAELRRGDGILVEGGREGRGELGGRVWAIGVDGVDVEQAQPGQRVLVWLGPESRGQAESLLGHRVWRSSSPANAEAIREELERSPSREPLWLTLRGQLHEAPRLSGRTAYGLEAEVLLDATVEEAETELPQEVLVDKLGRLGESPFELAGLEADLPARVRLPLSALNRGRRALVEALLLAARSRRWPTTEVTAAALLTARAGVSITSGSEPMGTVRPSAPGGGPWLPNGVVVLCRSEAQAEAALVAGASGVVLDLLELTGTGRVYRALRDRHPGAWLALAPPRIRKPGDEKIDRYLLQLEPDALYVRGLGALRDGEQDRLGPPRIGDFSLNVVNHLSAREVLSRGCQRFTPAYDLDAAQLVALLDEELAPAAEVVVHHPMPLFHMEHCVIAALLSDGADHRTCGRPCERHQLSLRDRAGMDHPVEADVGCRNTVFHAAAQSAATVVPRLLAAGVRRFRIELVRERPEEVARIVGSYRALLDGERPAAEVLRALRADGSYGVVRGSLRVFQEGAAR